MIFNKFHLFLFYYVFNAVKAMDLETDRKLCPVMKNVAQPGDRIDSSQRLYVLRQDMQKMTSVRGPPLDAFIITSYDQHMSEFVADRDRRLRWISGFSGDHGLAIVTLHKAILWTAPLDRLQADNELSCEWDLLTSSDESPGTWLRKKMQPGSRVGLDYNLISHKQWETLSRALQNSSIYLNNVPNNLVDINWKPQPNYSRHEAHVWPMEYAGKSWTVKLQQVRILMKQEKCDAFIVTALDEVAWLLNIRGRDIPHLPVLIAYVLVTKEQLHLYTDLSKLGPAVRAQLHTDACFSPYCARIHEYSQVFDDLHTFSQIWKRVWLPDESAFSPGASKAITSSIPSDKRVLKRSPIVQLKSEKNEREREGMRKAHIRDAAALCDLMAYLEQKLQLGEYVDELSLGHLLDQFRREQQLSQGISFSTIVGFGPHGALPHYQPTNATALKVDNTSMLVIDSGGFYLDGTTDVTRTFHLGIPTKEQKTAYTQVLMGLIGLSKLTFPEGLSTSRMDVIARAPLWDIHTDYPHGTGHGVGAYLSVHEGPIAISWDSKEEELLKEGQFFSIEPGFYAADKFGVRLENIVEVVQRINKSEVTMKYLGFNPVTLVPFEPRLMDINMLSPQQIRWLNNYNNMIKDEIGAELKRQLKMNGFHWMLRRIEHIPERSSGTRCSKDTLVILATTIPLLIRAITL